MPTVPTQPDKPQGTSMLAGLAPLLGVHSASLHGRLLGPGRAVAELRTPWPFCVYDDAPIVVKIGVVVGVSLTCTFRGSPSSG